MNQMINDSPGPYCATSSPVVLVSSTSPTPAASRYSPGLSNIYTQSWFPSNPDCPNHSYGVPYSSAYAELGPDGTARCPECFLNSTIRQSVRRPPDHYVTPPPTMTSPPYDRGAWHGAGGGGYMSTQAPPTTMYDYWRDVMPTIATSAAAAVAMTSQYASPPSLKQNGGFVGKVEPGLCVGHESTSTLSPAASVATTTTTMVAKHKSKNSNNRKRKADDLCQVCGDNASGYHYNALTCEGCKGFFRRSINRSHLLEKCKYGGKCEMDTYTRRKCPECRMKKCRVVGMLEECLLSAIQIQSKRKRQKNKKLEEIPNGILNEEGLNQQEEKYLTSYVRKAFQDYREDPEVVGGWKFYVEKDYHNTQKPSICKIATKHVQVLVSFIKKLPGFANLSCEDQIALVKGSVVPVMLLRNSCNYNLRKVQLEPEHVAKYGGIQESHVKLMMDFFSRMKRIGIDETEYGLLVAIITFDSDHKHVQNKDQVDRHRDTYLSALTHYSEDRQRSKPNLLAKILNMVTVMQSLHHSHSRLVMSWKQRQEMTPLLLEVWDE